MCLCSRTGLYIVYNDRFTYHTAHTTYTLRIIAYIELLRKRMPFEIRSVDNIRIRI
jgi:hypothetical protein